MPLAGGLSVNPIPTRGANHAHRITACPPGFQNPATSLTGIVPCYTILLQAIVHSVSKHKKRCIRNYTQILENLRNAIVGFLV